MTFLAIRRPFLALWAVGLLLCSNALLTAAPTSPDRVAELKTKAEDGNAVAQYNLGLILSDTAEPAYDPISGYVWLSLASENGSRSAELNQLTERLTSTQLAEGNQRLAERRAANAPVITAAPISTATLRITSATPTAAQAPVDALAKERITQLEAANAELTAKLKTAQAAPPPPSADTVKSLRIAEAALATKDQELASLRNELTTLRATPAPDAEEFSRLSTSLNKSSVELAEMRVARSQDNTARAQAESRQAALEAERDRLAQSLTEAQTQQNTLETQLRTQATELAEARAAIEAAETKLAAMPEPTPEPEPTVAPAELAELREKLTAQTDRAKVAEAALAAALVEFASTQGLPPSAGEQAAEADATAELARQTKRAEAAEGALAATLAEFASRFELPGTNPETLHAKIGTLQHELATAQAKVTKLQASLETSQADLTAAQAAAATPAEPADNAVTAEPDPELAATLASAQADLSAAQTQLDTQSAKIKALEADLATAQARTSALSTALAEIEGNQDSTLTAQATELAQAKNEAATLEQQLSAARSEITLRDARIARLESAVNANAPMAAELSRTQEELRQVQNNLYARDAEFAQLKAQQTGRPAPTRAGLFLPRRPGDEPEITPSTASALPRLATAAPVVSFAPGPEVSPTTTPATHTHVVVSGDTLSKIARQYYQNANRWVEILDANRSVLPNPNVLPVGTELKIP